MRGKEIGSGIAAGEALVHVLDALEHDVDVGLVEGGGPEVLFVGESGEEVAGAGAAVPDDVFVLPVLAEGAGEVVLRELDPAGGREEGALDFADVLRNEEVAAGDDVIPVFLLGGRR